MKLQSRAEGASTEAFVLEVTAADMETIGHVQELEFLPLQESALKRTGDYTTQHAQQHITEALK